MGAQRTRVRMPSYGLVVGVVLQLVAGVLAFLTDVPLVALVLCLAGLVCLGRSGELLRRT